MNSFLIRGMTDKQLLGYFQEKTVAMYVSSPSDVIVRSRLQWEIDQARGEIMSRMRERLIQHGAMD